MPARRFFVLDVHHEGDEVAIAGTDAHKIVNVLRLRNGDAIEIVDSSGAVFDAVLGMSDGALRARLRERREAVEVPHVVIDVAQGIPKGQKMDFVVEKLSELGVRTLIPLESERTIVQGVGSAKLERWQRLAHSAAQQSGRTEVLVIEDPTPLMRLYGRFEEYDAVLFLWEVATHQPLREQLPGIVNAAKSILVVVGPEGGFSHAEGEAARASGAHLLWLGPRILRTETAAMATVAILEYLIG
jgi:16S rRNA (uracil1498-N3)-methyltransferase